MNAARRHHHSWCLSAARAGLSLSEYLRREVSLLARRPTLDEFFTLVSARTDVPITAEQIVDAIHAERAAR